MIKKRMREKIYKGSRGQAEFGWIFAIIVGALILFFAFYFIGSKMNETSVTKNLMTEHSLDILFNPFSYFGSLGATSAKSVTLSTVEKINFSCESEERFGYDSILVWTKQVQAPRRVYDKYLFSDKFLEGKNFQIISKSFNMPWRVADLVYFFPKDMKYCFLGLSDIEKEFGDNGTAMNISNFYFPETGQRTDCPQDGTVVTICGNNNCDVGVFPDRVSKKDERGQRINLYYADDSQKYAAIFSDPEIYYCNLQRITQRLQYQIAVYSDKMRSLNANQCSISVNLDALNASAQEIINKLETARQNHNYDSSIGNALSSIKTDADSARYQNSISTCSLF